jgi:hypothetical protein
MSKNYKWSVLSPDEIWEQTSSKVRKNKKIINKSKLEKNGIKESISKEKKELR